VTFSLEVPWATLRTLGSDGVYITGADGVYTVGVQVLATDESGFRDPVNAVARARTFVPVAAVRKGGPTAAVAVGLLWPLREGCCGEATAPTCAPTVSRLPGLAGPPAHHGGTGRHAGDVPVSLVADPALLDAAEDFAAGSFGPPAATARIGIQRHDGRRVRGLATGGRLAAGRGHVVGLAGWVTGYGEPDPVAVADQATRGCGERSCVRAGSPPSGCLVTTCRPLPSPTPSGPMPARWSRWPEPPVNRSWCCPPTRLPEWDAGQGVALSVPTTVDGGDLPVLVADPALSAGGPEPGDPYSALQMRQRLLSETALLSMRGGPAAPEPPVRPLRASTRLGPGPSGTLPASSTACGRRGCGRPRSTPCSRGRRSTPTASRGAADAADRSDACWTPSSWTPLSALRAGPPRCLHWSGATPPHRVVLRGRRAGHVPVRHGDAVRRLAVTQRAASA
jgi:hypothetical protein